MRILLACTYVPFAAGPERGAAERFADQLRTSGLNVAISALPIDPDPSIGEEQCAWIRMLQLDPFAERLICLGSQAALLRHHDKRVWLADQFEVSGWVDDPGMTYERCLREAQILACESGHRQAKRQGAIHLRVPAEGESWQRASRTLAA